MIETLIKVKAMNVGTGVIILSISDHCSYKQRNQSMVFVPGCLVEDDIFDEVGKFHRIIER